MTENEEVGLAGVEDTETDLVDQSGKEVLYAEINEYLLSRLKTKERLPKSFGKGLFDFIVARVFVEAAKGSFRFNQGFGAFHVRTCAEGSRKTPLGEVVNFGPRQKLRYVPGVSVTALVNANGDVAVAEAALGREIVKVPLPKVPKSKEVSGVEPTSTQYGLDLVEPVEPDPFPTKLSEGSDDFEVVDEAVFDDDEADDEVELT